MDLSNVVSINVGNISISSVYTQEKKIWPTVPEWFDKGDWIAFDVYVSFNLGENYPSEEQPCTVTEDQYKQLFGYDNYKGYQHLYSVDGAQIPGSPMPEFVTTECGNCVRYWVAKGHDSYIYMSDEDSDTAFEQDAGIGTMILNQDLTYMYQLGWKWNGNSGDLLVGTFNAFDENTFANTPEAYTVTSSWTGNEAFTTYYHQDTDTTVRLCINKSNKVDIVP